MIFRTRAKTFVDLEFFFARLNPDHRPFYHIDCLFGSGVICCLVFRMFNCVFSLLSLDQFIFDFQIKGVKSKEGNFENFPKKKSLELLSCSNPQNLN